MTQKSLTQAVTNVVAELDSFASEDRHKIVQASMVILGEGPTRPALSGDVDTEDSSESSKGLPAKARSWMKQYGLTSDQLDQVFHLGDEAVQIIAAVPGASKKEQVRNAYVLCGIGRLLQTGETKFEDKVARSVCESGGFFDSTNHMKYMKGSEFTGSREKGWVLTAPGLKLGGSLVMQLSQD